MASPSWSLPLPKMPPPTFFNDLPTLYEDEEEGDMSESSPHIEAVAILHYGFLAHLADRLGYRVGADMNCYYRDGSRRSRTKSLPYVSPAVMVVMPTHDPGAAVSSYTINRDGSLPVLVAEVLSVQSAQQQDLKQKLEIYAEMQVPEYLLADTTGKYLHQRLLLKRLQRDRSGQDKQALDD